MVVSEGNKFTIRFGWRVRPGQKPPGPKGQETFTVEVVEHNPFVWQGAPDGMEVGADGGIAQISKTPVRKRGVKEGEAWFYLADQGKPVSNLIRIKVRYSE